MKPAVVIKQLYQPTTNLLSQFTFMENIPYSKMPFNQLLS